MPEQSKTATSFPPFSAAPAAVPQGTGSEWTTWTVLPAGTTLYHGTVLDFEGSDLDQMSWLTPSFDVAARFAERNTGEVSPRIHQYRLGEDVALPLITGPRQFTMFLDEFDVPHYGAEDMRDGMIESGLPGWVIPRNYPEAGGDDILLGPTHLLAYELTLAPDGTEIDFLAEDEGPVFGR